MPLSSSIAGRESAFISALIAAEAAADVVNNASPVLAVAAASVMQSGDAEQHKPLLDQLTQPKTPPWIQTALLDGVDRLIPRADDGCNRMAFLSAEPRALIAYASSDASDAARAAELLQIRSLAWRERRLRCMAREADARATRAVRQRPQRLRRLRRLSSRRRPRHERPRARARRLVMGQRLTAGGGSHRAQRQSGSARHARPGHARRCNHRLDPHLRAQLVGQRSRADHAQTVESIRSLVSHRDEPWSDEELQPLR